MILRIPIPAFTQDVAFHDSSKLLNKTKKIIEISVFCITLIIFFEIDIKSKLLENIPKTTKKQYKINIFFSFHSKEYS